MLFPIGDDQVKGGHKPVLSYSFIALNVLIFFLQSADPQGRLFIPEYGSIPVEITNGIDLHTLITSMFMHGGFMHLLGNMVFLWVFGDNIEATIGSAKFFSFYMIGGLAASGLHIVLGPTSPIPCVGASGAIAAVMGAYLVMFPKSKIKMIFILTFSSFKIPAMFFLGFWILQQVVSGVGALGATRGGDGGGVAFWAHIGGFIFGLIAGYYFRPKSEPMVLDPENLPGHRPVWERYT